MIGMFSVPFGALGQAVRVFREADQIRRFCLRHGRWERIGDNRIGNGTVCEAGLDRDRRWASNFSHGDRVTAKNYGCRC